MGEASFNPRLCRTFLVVMTKFFVEHRDFTKTPCRDYINLPKEGKIDVFAEIIKVKGELYAPDLLWAIQHCPKMQNEDMLRVLLSLKPDVWALYRLLIEVEFARTTEVFEAFLALTPVMDYTVKILARSPKLQNVEVLSTLLTIYKEAWEIDLLLTECAFARTPEVMTAYLSGQPSAWELYILMHHCDYAKTPEILATFLAANPDACDLFCLIRDCEFAQTPEVFKAFLAVGPPANETQSLMKVCPEFAAYIAA